MYVPARRSSRNWLVPDLRYLSLMITRTILFTLGICISSITVAQEPAQVIQKSDAERTEDLPVPEREKGEEPSSVKLDEMPDFPGGMEALFNYINLGIKYPAEERKAGVSGVVYVTFVVNKDGRISEAMVLRGIPDGPALDAEALRLVNAMPNWIPGKRDGEPVTVQYNLPIRFVQR